MQTYTKHGVYVPSNEQPAPLPPKPGEKTAQPCGKWTGDAHCGKPAILTCYDHHNGPSRSVVRCCAEHAITRPHPTAKLTYYGCPVVDEHTDE